MASSIVISSYADAKLRSLSYDTSRASGIGTTFAVFTQWFDRMSYNVSIDDPTIQHTVATSAMYKKIIKALLIIAYIIHKLVI